MALLGWDLERLLVRLKSWTMRLRSEKPPASARGVLTVGVLQELQAIVPAFPSVAVHLIIKKSEHEYGMLDSIRLHRSVVEDTYEYEDTDKVITSIRENIIAPAEAKVDELRRLIRPAAR
jgi:hypothetical protein